MGEEKNENKVGIVTFHGADNYGSVLQIYALQSSLEDYFGVSADVVNYVSDEQKQIYAIYDSMKGVKAKIKNLYVYLFQKKIREDKKSHFQQFRTQYLHLYPELESNEYGRFRCADYQRLICGSDQIWNIRIKDFKPIYMLSPFENISKASYAASMGGIDLKLSAEEKRRIGDSLMVFDKISVREKIAQKMLRECGIENAQVLIDPTFLLTAEKWKKLIGSKGFQGEYIFFYSVDYNPESVEIAQWYSKHFQLPVLIMYTSWRSYFICKDGIKWAGKTGVEDFLSLIYYAKFVLSGSFHGTAFSLIFNKPFYRIQKTINGQLVNDDRIHTLFEKLGVQGREINVTNYREKASDVYNIDFCVINQRIRVEKEKSIQYLKDFLT